MKLFPDVQQIIIQETKSMSTKTGEITEERHYYATSIKTESRSFQEVIEIIRRHWNIENSLHNIKDKTWNEDKHMLRRPRLGENFAVLLNLSIGFLHQLKIFGENCPISRRATKLSFRPELIFDIIT